MIYRSKGFCQFYLTLSIKKSLDRYESEVLTEELFIYVCRTGGFFCLVPVNVQNYDVSFLVRLL